MEDPPALSGSDTAVLAQEKMATAPNRLPFSVCPIRSESLRVLRTYWKRCVARRRERKHPRNRLVDTERKFIRITRLTVVKYTVQGRADPAQATGMIRLHSVCSSWAIYAALYLASPR